MKELTAPGGLRGLSESDLVYLRISTESELEQLERAAVRANEKLDRSAGSLKGAILSLGAKVANFPEDIRKKKLLLKLIDARVEELKVEGNRPKETHPPPPPEQLRMMKREECQNRLRDLQRDKVADLTRMSTEETSEDELKRRENMWDDAIVQEEEKLRKWL